MHLSALNPHATYDRHRSELSRGLPFDASFAHGAHLIVLALQISTGQLLHIYPKEP
ncbi:hypothetical protein B0H17DRAFT_551104 [Mycena rosella]|uniref:Uncharacterized protein n=1 Tax=Mycena rosella TaxID=1033263 RepID=A0AAD7DHU2_MYCRO|nr:hypothetical protein B0H17DRAFT_551104 [Mycena rosella]